MTFYDEGRPSTGVSKTRGQDAPKCPYTEMTPENPNGNSRFAIDATTNELTGPKGEQWAYGGNAAKFKIDYPSYHAEFLVLKEKLDSANLSVNIQTGIVALASLATFLAM